MTDTEKIKIIYNQAKQDRRHFKRFPSHIDIKFRYLKPRDGSIASLKQAAHITNFSQSGIFIECEEHIPKGSIVEVSFFIRSQGRYINILAEVIGHSSLNSLKGMGLRILKTSKKDFSEIIQHSTQGEWTHSQQLQEVIKPVMKTKPYP